MNISHLYTKISIQDIPYLIMLIVQYLQLVVSKRQAMIYLYEKASTGEIDLNEKLLYNGNFYYEGSGILKNKKYNTEYTVDTLINYTIHDSDNIAYAMLMNRFGRKNIYNYWKEKGTKNIFMYDTIWETTSANDAVIYMEELYKFYIENDEYGNKPMEYFKNAEWKQKITDCNKIEQY